MLFSRYFLVLLYYEKARSDSGKYDNASSLSGGLGDRIQDLKKHWLKWKGRTL